MFQITISNGYATVAQFQIRTGLTDAQTLNKTALIELEIENNSRIIDQVTSNIFYEKTLTASKAIFNFGTNADGLRMSENAQRVYFPGDILTLTTVLSEGDTLTEDEDYYASTNFIESDGIFSTTRDNAVKITGTCGSATTPGDVNSICLAMSEVTTGLGTYTMIDSSGSKTDVTRDNIPDWVFNQLNHRVRYDSYG